MHSRINWILRPNAKPGGSIELLFLALKPFIEREVRHNVLELPGSGNLLKDILGQIKFIKQLPVGNLVHVLGDVHYISLCINVKQVHTFHDLESLLTGSCLARTLKRYFWLKLPAKRSKAFSCISEHTKSKLSKVLKGNHPPITVIPNPLLLPILEEKCLPIGFSSKQRQYLSVGTKSNKNLSRVAQALQGRTNYQWHIVGALSEEEVNYFQQLGVVFKNYVHLSTAELTQLYQDCEVLLFPSLYEGFGLPILEAQANGTVVITSNCTAMPDTAGGAALFVDPLDVNSIKTAIEELEHNSELVSTLIKKGWENSQKYSVEKTAEAYVNWYNQVLEDV